MKTKISHYSFGSMEIQGREYISDLIIYPCGGIKENWRREQGHYLEVEDLDLVLETKPDVLVIGTGAAGVMSVSPKVYEECARLGILAKAMPTGEAVSFFNLSVTSGDSVAGCFHLTC